VRGLCHYPADNDTAVRVSSTKCLLQNRQPDETQLPWVETVTGVPGNDIFNSLHFRGMLGHMILTSFKFVCGIFAPRDGGLCHRDLLTIYRLPYRRNLHERRNQFRFQSLHFGSELSRKAGGEVVGFIVFHKKEKKTVYIANTRTTSRLTEKNSWSWLRKRKARRTANAD